MTMEIQCDDYVRVIERIYKNRYFTNHGPLAREFEHSLEKYSGVRSAVAISAYSMALLIALNGIRKNGLIYVPNTSSIEVEDVIKLSGIDYKYYEENELYIEDTSDSIFSRCQYGESVVLIHENEDKRIPERVLHRVTDLGALIIVYSEMELSNRIKDAGRNVVYVSAISSLFRVNEDHHGAVIFTNDDDFSDVFRNMRSSYGSDKHVDVVATCNGRFSEFQAGIGVILFERYSEAQNKL